VQEIQYRQVDKRQLQAAMAAGLGLVANVSTEAPAVRRLRAMTKSHDLAIDRQIAAFGAGKLLASCLCVISPGRTATIIVPPSSPDLPPEVSRKQVIVGILKKLANSCKKWDLAVLQSILPAGPSPEAEMFEKAGFMNIAELVYMQCRLAGVCESQGDPESTTYQSYCRENHDLFAKTVLASYQGSLDCPALSGLRNADDVITGHKSSGQFDPGLWFLLMYQDRPAGIAMVNRQADKPTVCELVYMAVLPEFRGRGLGRALLGKVAGQARHKGLKQMQLAVDAANQPGLRLYRRFGFRETDRRAVWAVLSKPRGEIL